MTELEIEIDGPEAMHALGARVGAAARGGDVIALVGDLGAGKTLFVQGLAEGLGVPPDVRVTSPTFTLVHTYEGGRVPLHHVDLYRLEREEQLEDVGLDELYRQDAVVAVEWFDRFPGPAERLELLLEVTSATTRRVHVIARGPRGEALAAELRA
jgi:tRNA threonylcarbamoyladenosine biosynthesis protein TsaE